MKKILYVASRISHISNFHMPYINYFKDKGYVVDLLCEGKSDMNVNKIYDIVFEKKIISFNNIKTINVIKKILEKEKYDIIITNTTLSSFIVRMAKQISNVKSYGKLINIVHGYLFSRNSKLLKKYLYILAEKLCKKSTDLLLTMNMEDYYLADKYKLSKSKIKNIKGMGIPNTPEFCSDIRDVVRDKYNISEDDILLIYVGELSKRKNQIFLIKKMKDIVKKIPNIKLILAGDGQLYDYYKNEIMRLDLKDNIILAGYVKNIKQLIYSADIVVSSSLSEGLPFNIMEAMSLSKVVLASNIKGHTDLIKDGYNSFLFKFDNDNYISFENKLSYIIDRKDLEYIKQNALESIDKYMLKNVFYENIKILEDIIC